MRRVSFIPSILLVCWSPSQAAEAPPVAEGMCTYFLGLCVTCEQPLLCRTSERIDPTQSFGSQAARSTLQTGAIGHATPSPITPVPVKKQPKPVSPQEAREFEAFKKFLRKDGHLLRTKDGSDELALYQKYLRWKAQSVSAVPIPPTQP